MKPASSTRALVTPALAVALTLLLPASAGAHAFLVRSDPAAGAELAHAPRALHLFFDEGVRPTSGMEVVRNGGGSMLAGRPFVPAGKPTEIVLPLRPHLPSGGYSVRWREIDVDDGHLIVGVFAFKVGRGGPPPQSALSAGSSNPPLRALASRWLLVAALLVAAGTTIFGLLVWRPLLRPPDAERLAARQRRAQALLLAAALALAAVAALLSVVLEPGASGTSFGLRMEIGAAVAAAAAVCSLASLRVPRLMPFAAIAAIVLLGLPTATGHALQRGTPHALSVPADLVHLASAAFWIGGSLELVLVAPLLLRRVGPGRRRIGFELVRRYSPLAVTAVALLGASGVLRAVTELNAFDQLWTTGYGRTLLVKTGILACLLALGWLNRYRLLPALRRDTTAALRLRRSVAAELLLLATALGAVAVLINLRPGRDDVPAAAASTVPRQTVVLAAEEDDLAVGLRLTPSGGRRVALRATVLGSDGPAAALGLRFVVTSAGAARFAAASACGPGCYRASAPISGRPRLVLLRIARPGRPPATLTFTPPVRWPAPGAAKIVRRARKTTSRLHTRVVRSRLASDAHHELTTTYAEVAPDRLAYRNTDGSAAIIVADRRWDRSSRHGRWVESAQRPPVRVPIAFWPPRFTDAHLLRRSRVDGHPVWVVSFLDPTTPAWFTIWVDRRSYQTLRLQMTATGHFMNNRNGPFNAPITVEAPLPQRPSRP